MRATVTLPLEEYQALNQCQDNHYIIDHVKSMCDSGRVVSFLLDSGWNGTYCKLLSNDEKDRKVQEWADNKIKSVEDRLSQDIEKIKAMSVREFKKWKKQ